MNGGKSLVLTGDAGLGLQETVQLSFLYLKKEHAWLADDALQWMVQHEQQLKVNPLLLPRYLYQLVVSTTNVEWLTQSCSLHHVSMAAAGYRQCPPDHPLCCSALSASGKAVALSPRAIYPAIEDDVSLYQATISVRTHERPADYPATPNFFDVLNATGTAPSDICYKCMRMYSHNLLCVEACAPFYNQLCKTSPPAKFTSQSWTVHPPALRHDPHRIIPRIVHQTWFEALDTEKYPMLSRLAKSFELSGWEYRFYSDADIAAFLTKHFPPTVKEAYDSLIPGAFKADLFRYCVLLIHGGLYADVDILLETNLDDAIAPDVSFLAPTDDPGMKNGHRMCLWNGFMAAAPGHAFLAKAIERVVNQVRNRFTSIDIDATMCPIQDVDVLHAHDMLFIAGPCALGSAVNEALGSHPQTNIAVGESWSSHGKMVILQHNKTDLGAQRFSSDSRIIAATEMTMNDDRKKKFHYSNTRSEVVYGLENVYVDREIADEVVRVSVSQRGKDQRSTALE